MLAGNGSAARFDHPVGVTVDGAGNVYLTDSGNKALRKISPAGDVSTLAVGLKSPCGVGLDKSGNLYVAECYNYTIKKITATGSATTLAGSSGCYGYADGIASAAQFFAPIDLAVDDGGNVFVADSSNAAIRRVTPAGEVGTVIGGPAKFRSPSSVAFDRVGNVYVTEVSGQYSAQSPGTVRKITPEGQVITLAGWATMAGTNDGLGALARFSDPAGVVVDDEGVLFVADSGNCTIRRVSAGAMVTTLAGSPGLSGTADGRRDAARFSGPHGMAMDRLGNLYVADEGNHTIRKVTPAGEVTTLAGRAGSYGSLNGIGSNARFSSPAALALDGAGNLYVADRGNCAIRKMTPAAEVTTLAGNPFSCGSTDGVGDAARFNNPTGLAVDVDGNVFVADAGNHTVRKVTPGGHVTTLAGAAGVLGYADGVGWAARFYQPTALAVDNAGCLYVADTYNHTIRKGVNPSILFIPSSTVKHFSDGRYQFAIRSATDAVVEVQVCTNLALGSWMPIGLITNQTGNDSFTDLPSGRPQRFYRLKRLQ